MALTKRIKKNIIIANFVVMAVCLLAMAVIFLKTPNFKKSSVHIRDRTTSDVALLPYFSKYRLRHLRIESIDITPEEVAALKRFKNLRALWLRNCGIGDKEMECIANFPKLKVLVIEESKISDDGLAPLANLHDLKTLKLVSNNISDNGLAYLSELHNLHSLHLVSDNISDNGLAHLSELHNLKILWISSNKMTGSGLAHLKESNLQSLDCSGNSFTAEGIASVSLFENLRDLNLYYTFLTDAALTKLTHNYWLVCLTPSPGMTTKAVQNLRETLIDGRKQAREKGTLVPPEDLLFINSPNPEFKDTSLPPKYYKKLDKFMDGLFDTGTQ